MAPPSGKEKRLIDTLNTVFCSTTSLDNTGQQVSKHFFICDEYVINLFASMKLEKGHNKNYLVLILKFATT